MLLGFLGEEGGGRTIGVCFTPSKLADDPDRRREGAVPSGQCLAEERTGQLPPRAVCARLLWKQVEEGEGRGREGGRERERGREGGRGRSHLPPRAVCARLLWKQVEEGERGREEEGGRGRGQLPPRTVCARLLWKQVEKGEERGREGREREKGGREG